MRHPPSAPGTGDRARPEGPVERRIAQRLSRPTVRQRGEILSRQATLAERVAAYIRDQRQDARVGLAAGALLLAASGAALAYGIVTPGSAESVALAPVQPLSQEITAGLPTTPGRYPVASDSVTRDAQGVYRFSWRDPLIVAGPARQATVSQLRLAPGDADEIEVPTSGDPILHLRPSTPVGVVAQVAEQPTSTAGGSTVVASGGSGFGRTYVHVGSWFPYEGSYSRSPVYRAPPPTDRFPTDGRLAGSVESPRPLAPSQRTVNVPARADAVSGQARGTGAGTAVTGKSGLSTSGSGISAPRSGGFSSGTGGSSSSSSS